MLDPDFGTLGRRSTPCASPRPMSVASGGRRRCSSQLRGLDRSLDASTLARFMNAAGIDEPDGLLSEDDVRAPGGLKVLLESEASSVHHTTRRAATTSASPERYVPRAPTKRSGCGRSRLGERSIPAACR
jgi:hypothetical protein